MYCRVYLRQKFYNLNCILMMTCIFVETSIPMFPTLSLSFYLNYYYYYYYYYIICKQLITYHKKRLWYITCSTAVRSTVSNSTLTGEGCSTLRCTCCSIFTWWTSAGIIFCINKATSSSMSFYFIIISRQF